MAPYTALQFQPSVRLHWTLASTQTLCAAFTCALRRPAAAGVLSHRIHWHRPGQRSSVFRPLQNADPDLRSDPLSET